MKKTLLLIVAAVLSTSVFAQGNTFAEFKEGEKAATKKVETKLKAAGETAKIAQLPAYKLGSKIDLQALNGKVGEFRIVLPAGKKFVSAKAKTAFPIYYSKYSFNFDFKIDKDGALLIKITPVEKKDEELLPVATATFTMENNELSAYFHAITMDDYNDGLGWGIIEDVAEFK